MCPVTLRREVFLSLKVVEKSISIKKSISYAKARLRGITMDKGLITLCLVSLAFFFFFLAFSPTCWYQKREKKCEKYFFPYITINITIKREACSVQLLPKRKPKHSVIWP